MKIFFILAAILLVTGCKENANSTRMQQAAPKQISIEAPARHASEVPVVTQASSTATPGARKSSISMKQVPNAVPPRNQAEQTSASSQFDQQVLQLVNKQRASTGLAALEMDENLSKMAMVKAQDMYNNNYFDHTSPTYGSPFDMMNKFQITFNTAGENIAKGQPSPEQVMNDWMNSEGHKANILNSSFTKIGIAYYNGEWVQEFIS
jgi:uncharacterized YkwD family protein